MKLNPKAMAITGLTLVISGLAGIIIVSSEPTEIIESSGGMLTAIPRIPWASVAAEFSIVAGIGLISVAIFVKWTAEKRNRTKTIQRTGASRFDSE